MGNTAPVRLAIIGSAGRNDDALPLSQRPEFFLGRMLDAGRAIADRVGATALVSGGAAWADHIAILLFLSDPERFELHLHLPALLKHHPTDRQAMFYLDTGSRQNGSNPARVSNELHEAFGTQLASHKPGWSPFHDLRKAFFHPRVTTTTSAGFEPRNARVAADSDFALAMTFGDGPVLKKGGTAGTLSAFLKQHDASTAYHLDMGSMRLCRNAALPAGQR